MYAFIKSTFSLGLIVLILLITSFIVAFLCLWKSLSLWEGVEGLGRGASLTWLQERAIFQSYTVWKALVWAGTMRVGGVGPDMLLELYLGVAGGSGVLEGTTVV